MDLGAFSWNLMKLVGVVVLVIVIAYAAYRNFAKPKSDVTEEATRRVYEEEEKAHHGESDDVV